MDIKALMGDKYTPEIEKALYEAIGKEFIPKEKYDDKLAVIKDINEKLAERDKQLEDLTPKAAGNEALMAEITKLQEANKIAAEESRNKYREKLLDIKLNEQKPISLKALKAELDLSKINYDDSDNIVGLDEQLKALRESETLKGLFVAPPAPVAIGTGIPNNTNPGIIPNKEPPKIF